MLGTLVGKLVRVATRWRPHGGHALPGRVVERLFPGYLAAMTRQLPEGVVIVTGTNGKTTTVKLVVETLRACGKDVVTNPTGSNMSRGLVSGLVRRADRRGRLACDLAVFETDEAHARRLVDRVRPRWVLALNVSRDQLDRFGEVDAVAELVGAAMGAATEGVVTNADDPRLRRLGEAARRAGRSVDYFAVAPELAALFPADDEAAGPERAGRGAADGPRPAAGVEVVGLDHGAATFRVGGRTHAARLRVTGQHNAQNAAAALALVRHLLPGVPEDTLVARLAEVEPAFGRGETFVLDDGSGLVLVLVKNPAGFRQALASYLDDAAATMVAVNDGYVDGRDVSWLWDADVSRLVGRGVDVTSGTRAADVALRLGYGGVDVRAVESDLHRALARLGELPGPKLVLANYTAMLRLHGELTGSRRGSGPAPR